MALFIGLMSGTSADAIDAALVEIQSATKIALLAQYSHPLPAAYRAQVLQLSQDHAPVFPHVLAQLDVQAGRLFADAALALLHQENIPAASIRAIGSHGQTLYHQPSGEFPYTWQFGDPNVIAQRSGITTVADFRRRDVAAGGQGAPLAPAFHAAVFRVEHETRVVLNLGGIANITLLPADPTQAVIGYDTGPANALLDAWAMRNLGQSMDENGRWAVSGQVLPALLQILWADPYFQHPYPKSSGRDYFNLAWLQRRIHNLDDWLPADIQATLAELTVTSAATEIARFQPQRLLVVGGGVHNPLLMAGLARHLPQCEVVSTAALGVDPDWIEAMCFAWLAYRTLAGEPGNLPSVTGAAQSLVLGGIYHGGGQSSFGA